MYFVFVRTLAAASAARCWVTLSLSVLEPNTIISLFYRHLVEGNFGISSLSLAQCTGRADLRADSHLVIAIHSSACHRHSNDCQYCCKLMNVNEWLSWQRTFHSRIPRSVSWTRNPHQVICGDRDGPLSTAVCSKYRDISFLRLLRQPYLGVLNRKSVHDIYLFFFIQVIASLVSDQGLIVFLII